MEPFGPESAAHVGREHPHLLGRDPQDHGHGVPHEVGILGGRPDDEPPGLGVPIGEHAARLDRHGRDSRVAQFLLDDDQVGGGKGALDVTRAAAHDHGGVVGPVLVNPLGAERGGLGRRHGRERLVVDHDPVHRVGQAIRVVRQDDGHRLADVPHHLRREHALHVGTGPGRVAERRGNPSGDLRQVGGGQDRDPRHSASLVRDDPAEPGVRVGASYHAEVNGPGASEVVQVPAAALQQGDVLLAARRRADRARGHAVGPGR